MLQEKQEIRQIENEGFRRWFFDKFFDLIVWYDDESLNTILGFQLCYDKNEKERALTWSKRHGYSHTKVDDGEMPYGNKMTPILVSDGVFEKDTILEMFKEASENLDPEIRSLVSGAVGQYDV